MFLSHLERMEICSQRQRQAFLILPFVQQLSRREEESKFAFLKFEKSHASFQNVGGCTHEREKRRVNAVLIHRHTYTQFLFFAENDPIIRQLWHWLLMMMIDKNVFFIHTYMYISMCTHTSRTAVYCQLSSFCNDRIWVNIYLYLWWSVHMHRYQGE